MTIRKILAPIAGYDSLAAMERAALQTALTVGCDLAAHVEVFCQAANPAEVHDRLPAGVPGATIDQLFSVMEQVEAAQHARAHALFSEVTAAFDAPIKDQPAGDSGFSAAFVQASGAMESLVAARGRVSDLIVAGIGPDGDGRHPTALLQAALLETGRPLLMAPAEAPKACGRRVAVAWNASSEAARAVALAGDFLARADEVAVITVAEDPDYSAAGKDLSEYFAWHGIKAQVCALGPPAQSAGSAVLDQAADFGADLLVMGAYTRSRLRRMIFGGVTATVFREARIPVFMAD